MNCLKTCDYKATPYCIGRALIAGKEGDMNNGYVFSGANAGDIHEIAHVKDLMDELVSKLN
jgi:NAD(P)H-dependent flavin oxidoreductase YrpB (nitropropane dioxygenase family)